jgi:hypothetical protein
VECTVCVQSSKLRRQSNEPRVDSAETERRYATRLPVLKEKLMTESGISKLSSSKAPTKFCFVV